MLTSGRNCKNYSEKQICIFKIIFLPKHYDLQPSHYCFIVTESLTTEETVRTSFLYAHPEDKKKKKGEFTKRQHSTKMNLKAHTLIYFSSSTNTPIMYDNSWQDIFKEKVIQGQLMKESFYWMTVLPNLLWLPIALLL